MLAITAISSSILRSFTEGTGGAFRRPRIFGNSFVRSTLIVAGGTAGAQALAVAFSPIITRLYSPEVYGHLTVFTSILAVVASVATLSYANAIALPKNDAVAYRMFMLSLAIPFVFSGLLTLTILFFGREIAALLGLEAIADYMWLLPLAALLQGIIQAFSQWQIRKQLFKQLSISSVIQAAVAGLSRSCGGLIAPNSLLLISLGVFSHAVQAGLLYRSSLASLARARRKTKSNTSREILSIKAIARRYRDFPWFRAPQLLLNTTSAAAPLLFLASMFGPSSAAFYGVAQSVLYLPVNLISQSVGKVFLQRIAAQSHQRLPLAPMLLRTTLVLFVLGSIPFGIIILAGQFLFSFIFGEEWHTAGTYAQWLSIMVFFHFINVPSVQSLAITKSQPFLLGWEVVTTTMKIALLFIVGQHTGSAEMTVAAYALFGAVAYAVLIIEGTRRSMDLARIRVS